MRDGACTSELHTHPHPARDLPGKSRAGLSRLAAAGKLRPRARREKGKRSICVCNFAKSERMPTATVTTKQITIPKAIRLHLKLVAGDRLHFVIERNGRVVLMPATIDASEHRGLLAPAPHRLSIEEMDAAIRKHGAARKRSTSIR
jgi:antitoxin PrlF